MILVFVEHGDGLLTEASEQALTFARRLADIDVICIGAPDIASLAAHGVQNIHQAEIDGTYAPMAWGRAVSEAAEGASAVVAAGTERGNEVLAHAAIDLGASFAANCIESDGEAVTRIRWGGSLREEAGLGGDQRVMTIAPHSVEAVPADAPTAPSVRSFAPKIDQADLAVRIVDQEQASDGVTLATAKVVVSGGRGVGSAEGFGELEELAALLGGKVGCSRVATNNGWRNHADQVGQTGTVIAPDLYIACGISGAIQHWVGMMASKQILAINTDAEAPMVTKADYAIIGDLHDVIPAITAAVRAAQG